jgi:hypothetical protein
MSESEQGFEQTAQLGDTSSTDAHAQEETQQNSQGGNSFEGRVRSDGEYRSESVTPPHRHSRTS